MIFPDPDQSFVCEEMFVGAFEGWGVIEGPLGGLKKRFVVLAEGRSESGVLWFDETWRFDDGHVDRLAWEIRRLSEGRYEGQEPRLEGKAAGDVDGVGFRWRYTRDTPQPDGSILKLNFDDTFWRINDQVMVVRGAAGRLGVPFAIAHVTYRRYAP